MANSEFRIADLAMEDFLSLFAILNSPLSPESFPEPAPTHVGVPHRNKCTFPNRTRVSPASSAAVRHSVACRRVVVGKSPMTNPG